MAGSGYKNTYATQLDQTWDPSDTDVFDNPGDIRVEDNKHYVAVRASAAITAGKFCGYRADGTVRMNGTTGVGAGWAETAIPSGKIGWVQFQGRATIPAGTIDSGVEDGHACKLSATTGGNLAPMSEHTSNLVAEALDESAGIVFIRCNGGW